MNNQSSNESHVSPFDAICRLNEQGNEYWSARELSKLLGYTRFDKFLPVIAKAEEACKNSGQAISDHMSRVRQMIATGKGAKREAEDVFLSRYGAYLAVQNADPDKPTVALGQTYFTIQTRRQEIVDEMTELPENQQRLIRRSQMSVLNTQLAETAKKAGVVTPKDFGIFQDHGYKGLYDGESARAIKTRKNLPQSEDILDWMNSDELAANAFRASLARQKIEREHIQGKEHASRTHYHVGKKVRQTIEELGGTMPENLPTPEKSIQQLQRDEQRRIEHQRQPSLFHTLENGDNDHSKDQSR